MALVCPCQAVAYPERVNGGKGPLCPGKPACNISLFRLSRPDAQAPLNLKLLMPKAAWAWGHGGDVCVLRQSRDASHCERRWRATERKLAGRFVGANCERNRNGARKTMALTQEEKVGYYVEDSAERTFPSDASSSSETKILEVTPTNGSEATFLVERVALSSGYEEGVSLTSATDDSPNLPVTHGVGSNCNLKDKFEEHEKKLQGLEKILGSVSEWEQDLRAVEAELLAYSDKDGNRPLVNERPYARIKEALHTARGIFFQLNSQVGELKKGVVSKDALLGLTQNETFNSAESLQRTVQSLSDAERRIHDLETQKRTGEESLCRERGKVAAAVRSIGLLEQAARVAENKVANLTTELSSLKALAVSGRRSEHLSAQVKALEEELKSRDSILREMRAETVRSAEALKVAAQIKQDLNATRHREVQLVQALQGANELVKELQTDLVESLRTMRAEQGLKQVEKMLWDARLEVDLLRKGVEERDKSIHTMKEEVDLNIELLSNAAQDRQNLHTIKLQMEELRAELGSKDTKLRIIREEMASIINLAKQNQGVSSVVSNSILASSFPVVSPSGQMIQPNKRSQSRKQTGRQRTPRSTQ